MDILMPYYSKTDPASDLKWNICHITSLNVEENHNKNLWLNLGHLKMPKTQPKRCRHDI